MILVVGEKSIIGFYNLVPALLPFSSIKQIHPVIILVNVLKTLKPYIPECLKCLESLTLKNSNTFLLAGQSLKAN